MVSVAPHHAMASRFELVSQRPGGDGEAPATGIHYPVKQPEVSDGMPCRCPSLRSGAACLLEAPSAASCALGRA